MTMTLRVTNQDLYNSRDEGSVVVVTGYDEDTHDRVTFAGDRRVMDGLAEAVVMNDGHSYASVEEWQVLGRTPCRRAVLKADSEVAACKLAKQVKNYLPANYQVVGCHGGVVTVEGHDHAGWTLDGYVLPRLASGLLWATEVQCQPVNDLGGQDPAPRFGRDENDLDEVR